MVQTWYELTARTHPPKILYHYTTTAGLKGILSNRTLWLCDVEFMNDAEELIFGRELVSDACLTKATEIWPEDRDRDESIAWLRGSTIRSAVGELRSNFDMKGVHGGGQFHAYAACFCKKGDLLSQWRAYAKDGGYAIGFRSDLLTGALPRGAAGGLVKVRYGAAEAKPDVNKMAAEIAPNANAHIGTEAYYIATLQLLPLCAAIKHPSFEEEQEWRLLATGDDVAVSFREAPFGLVPYVEQTFPAGAVAEIVIGPGVHADLRFRSVHQFLRRSGYAAVDVRRSRSPLRQ